MSKRKYTHIQKILPEIQAMIANGKSRREIEEFFGLTGDRPVHNLLKRERRKDNAMAENFFSILKTECIYRHLPATLDEARILIDNYIYFYNHQRIQLKTGVTPLALRHSS